VATPQRIGVDLGEKKVLADINEYGWTAINILEDDGHPPWTFTIGLYETWDHPEFIVIGRSRATSHAMLKALADDIELNCPPDLTDPDGAPALRHEVSLPRSQHPLLLRLCRLRKMVLPQAPFPLVSNRLAEQ
jgi:hypothetical protein